MIFAIITTFQIETWSKRLAREPALHLASLLPWLPSFHWLSLADRVRSRRRMTLLLCKLDFLESTVDMNYLTL